MFVFCLFAAAYHMLYVAINSDNFKTLIHTGFINRFVLFIVRFGNWVQLLSGLFPISILFTIKLINFLSALRFEEWRTLWYNIPDSAGNATGQFFKTTVQRPS